MNLSTTNVHIFRRQLHLTSFVDDWYSASAELFSSTWIQVPDMGRALALLIRAGAEASEKSQEEITTGFQVFFPHDMSVSLFRGRPNWWFSFSFPFEATKKGRLKKRQRLVSRAWCFECQNGAPNWICSPKALCGSRFKRFPGTAGFFCLLVHLLGQPI